MTNKPEPFLPPKELPDALAAIGLPGYSLRACYRLVHALKADGVAVVRGKYVRASDVLAFLVRRPGWQPFAKTSQKM